MCPSCAHSSGERTSSTIKFSPRSSGSLSATACGVTCCTSASAGAQATNRAAASTSSAAAHRLFLLTSYRLLICQLCSPVTCRIPRRGRISSAHLHREPGSLPGEQPARHVDHVGEAKTSQVAGHHRTAHAVSAVHHNRHVAGKLLLCAAR